MENPKKNKILFSPLDWGLGHATRCIPIITELLNSDAQIFMAGEGAQMQLLLQHFPDLWYLPLKGYRITYTKNRRWFLWKMIFKIPRLLRAINYENQWLNAKHRQFNFDLIISDNRLGMHHKNIKTIFITHQLAFQTAGGKLINKWLQNLHYRYINKFSECWVPDMQNEGNLAGALSHPLIYPKTPVKYLGILSRLKKMENTFTKHQVFISISGPEPQRTIFENIILNQLVNTPLSCVVVRGLVDEKNILPSTQQIKIYNHLPTDEFSKAMQEAEWVISRSGYSTLMDIVATQKRAILIPTPGQPEQEYLAKYFLKNQYALAYEQDKFNLQVAVDDAKQFAFSLPRIDSAGLLKQVVKDLLNEIKA